MLKNKTRLFGKCKIVTAIGFAFAVSTVQLATGTNATAQDDDGASKLLGKWKIDVEATTAYLKELDREDELDDGFHAIASTIRLEFLKGGNLKMRMQPPGLDQPMTQEQNYVVTVEEDGSLMIDIDGNAGTAKVEFQEDGSMRFNPDDSFPVVLVRSKADEDKAGGDKADDDKKDDDKKGENKTDGSDTKSDGEMTGKLKDGAPDFIGEWRINMEKTQAHLKAKGMEQEELDEIGREMAGLQIEYIEDGKFKMEIGGILMNGTWEVKNFDEETNVSDLVLNLEMGGQSRPRDFKITKVEDGVYIIAPEGDPESIFERIKEDDSEAKSDDGSDDDN